LSDRYVTRWRTPSWTDSTKRTTTSTTSLVRENSKWHIPELSTVIRTESWIGFYIVRHGTFNWIGATDIRKKVFETDDPLFVVDGAAEIMADA
jgi:hypothetical protein